MLIPIDDPDDPRLEPYRNIRERDLVGRQGLFIAEGRVVLRALLAGSLHQAQSLLIAEKHAGTLAGQLPLPADLPVYVAAQGVLAATAGFSVHRGLLGLGRRAAPVAAATVLDDIGPDRALVLALFGIANHDNMGGIFRNAAAFGVDAVLLDTACCDPLYRKAIRVSVGATLRLPFARLAVGEDVVTLLARRGFATAALSPSGDRPLAALPALPRQAVLLGAEGAGLPQALLQRSQSVAIGMNAAVDSLNVATTSGIVLYHLAVRRPAGADPGYGD